MSKDTLVAALGVVSLAGAIFTYNNDAQRYVTILLLVLSGAISMLFCSRISRMINRLNEANCSPRLPIVWGMCVLAAAIVMLFD
jgi:NADH:ubiquinone oxidoreductase subunit 6 (subunit J)